MISSLINSKVLGYLDNKTISVVSSIGLNAPISTGAI